MLRQFADLLGVMFRELSRFVGWTPTVV